MLERELNMKRFLGCLKVKHLLAVHFDDRHRRNNGNVPKDVKGLYLFSSEDETSCSIPWFKLRKAFFYMTGR